MSKKRTSPESSTEGETNDGSDPFRQDNNTKRVKLTSFSDTTLQDLPIELIEFILIKAVTMEVKGMRLAKSVWKERADLVISRLTTVCPQWSYILTTNFFRDQLNKTLDAQGTIRLEILHQSPLQPCVSSITTMKDEIFMLCTAYRQGHVINVYNRNNMAEVTDVIPLSGLHPHCIAGCSVSNCVYMLSRVFYHQFSIWRIARNDEHQYTLSQAISSMYLPKPTMCVTANGSLVFTRRQLKNHTPVIICDANGSIQHEMRLRPNIISSCKIIPKSNGNLVFVSGGIGTLREIDMDGNIIRKYRPSLNGVYASDSISHSDNYGRILLADHSNKIQMELIDSEFNRVDLTGQLLGEGQVISPHGFHYNSDRNEIVAIVGLIGQTFQNRVLTIFHLRDI